MPTVFKLGKGKAGIKFKVNKRDHNPPHVHVEFKAKSVRIEIKTRVVMDPHPPFNSSELAIFAAEIEKREEMLMKKWEAYHGKAK